VVHNRYRLEGGEERAVELQLAALERAGIEHRLLERRSAEAGRAGAAAAMLRGGSHPEEIVEAVRDLRADVVHVHNMQPLVGPLGLSAAREAGARVVLQVHNLRLFCAIGVAARDGGPCFRCRGRRTLPGLVLNCRGSLSEAAVYAAALAAHQPRVLRAADRFLAPSGYAAARLAWLGLPEERLEVLPHFLPAAAFAERSGAADGTYALVLARLSEEKGVDLAVQAAARAGVPLRVAGEGAAAGRLAALAAGLRAPVELTGAAGRDEVAGLLAGAAMLLVPSRSHEFAPYAGLEAMAAGVPVVATAMGGLPELVGPGRCVPPNDPEALARRLRELWERPELRRSEGEALLRRARGRHSEEGHVASLLAAYERLLRAPSAQSTARQ
jgi:glycosyltransferase involved in cell wall biosynthesis